MKLTHKSFRKSLLVGAIAASISTPVFAGNHGQGNSTLDYAHVVSVDPIYESYQVNQPIKQCYHKKVPVRDRAYKNKSKTPEIVGAIIGGVVGNRVGKRGGGSARDVATVAGAVLGGSIGRDIKHKNSRRSYDGYTQAYRTVKHCDVKDHYVTEKQLVGYDVAYKYRGKIFYTTTDYDPGDKIKVKVSVSPV